MSGLLVGRHAMLLRAVRNTEWRQLIDFVSPSLFDVMPMRALLSQGRELGANATGGSFDAARRRAQARLDAGDIAVRIEPSRTLPETPPALRRSLGQHALEIYFAQILNADEALLDLRHACWAQPAPDAVPVWAPRPLWLRWDPAFLSAVRDLYTGFYREDDRAWERGVETLGLDDAGELLRRHFGEGDQRTVRFDSAVFQTTFHQVFVRCRNRGIELHRNFLALGAYLATLYDLLETLGGTFDVRDAFDRANRSAREEGGAREDAGDAKSREDAP